jgi:hypothetical protein
MANERSPLKMDAATSSEFEHTQPTDDATAAAAAALLSSPTAHQRAQPKVRYIQFACNRLNFLVFT